MEAHYDALGRSGSYGMASSQVLSPSLGHRNVGLGDPPSMYKTGSFSMAGAKPNMPHWVNQDSFLDMKAGHCLLVGVFDGHGPDGHTISNLAKSLIAERAQAFAACSNSSLEASFKQIFQDIASKIDKDCLSVESGTTATVALIDTQAQLICIANIGDSTAILVDGTGSIVFQSRDHKPSDATEAARLKAHGSQISEGRLVMNAHPEASIGLARSFGDFRYKLQGVISEPEVVVGLPFGQGFALILATDGVWDMASKDYVSQTMLRNSPEVAAESIVSGARLEWQRVPGHIDDITCVVVKNGDVKTATATPDSSPAGSRPGSPMLKSIQRLIDGGAKVLDSVPPPNPTSPGGYSPLSVSSTAWPATVTSPSAAIGTSYVMQSPAYLEEAKGGSSSQLSPNRATSVSQAVLTPLPPAEGDAVALFRTIDTNNNGVITLEEFVAAYEKGLIASKQTILDLAFLRDRIEKLEESARGNLQTPEMASVQPTSPSNKVTIAKRDVPITVQEKFVALRNARQHQNTPQDVSIHPDSPGLSTRLESPPRGRILSAEELASEGRLNTRFASGW